MDRLIFLVESIAANSAYLFFLIFAISQNHSKGIFAIAAVIFISKISTALIGTLLSIQSGHTRHLSGCLLISKTIAFFAILTAAYFQNVLQIGLVVISVVSACQYYENNLRAAFVKAGHNKHPVSPELLNSVNQGSLIFAVLIYVLSKTYFRDQDFLSHWPPLILVFASMCTNSVLRRERLAPSESIPHTNLKKSLKQYFAQVHVKKDLILAGAFVGSNTLTIYTLGAHAWAVPSAIFISGLCVWVSMFCSKHLRPLALITAGIFCNIVFIFLKPSLTLLPLALVIVYNFVYWSLFHQITGLYYAQKSSPHDIVGAIAIRSSVLVLIAAVGELLTGFVLKYSSVHLFIVIKVLCVLIVIVVNRFREKHERLLASSHSYHHLS